MQSEQLRNEIKNIVPLMNKKELEKANELLTEAKDRCFVKKGESRKLKSKLDKVYSDRYECVKKRGEPAAEITVLGVLKNLPYEEGLRCRKLIPVIGQCWWRGCLVCKGKGEHYYNSYEVRNEPVYLRPYLILDETKTKNLSVGDIFNIGTSVFKLLEKNIAIQCGILTVKMSFAEMLNSLQFVEKWYEKFREKYSIKG